MKNLDKRRISIFYGFSMLMYTIGDGLYGFGFMAFMYSRGLSVFEIGVLFSITNAFLGIFDYPSGNGSVG